MGQFSVRVISQFGLGKVHLPCPKDCGFREQNGKRMEKIANNKTKLDA